MVQRMVAAFAEAINYVDKNPAKTKAAIAKVMRIKDEEALQVSYNVYTKDIVDRRMIVPGQTVHDTVELLRSLGTPVKRRVGRSLRQQFRQQPGEERLSQRAVGEVNWAGRRAD